VDKTCKSSATTSVAIQGKLSGARVRNTWVICREVGDNPEKSGLIPNVVTGGHLLVTKAGDRKTWRFMISPRPIS
jgi:hypothetical protein